MSCLLLNLSRLLCTFFSYVARVVIWWVRLALTCRNEQVVFSCWVLRSRGWIRTHQHELNVPFDQRGLGPALSWPPLWRGSHMPSPSITRGCTVAFAGSINWQILCPSWTPWRCWGGPLERRWVVKEDWCPAKSSTDWNPNHTVQVRGSLARLDTRNTSFCSITCKLTFFLKKTICLLMKASGNSCLTSPSSQCRLSAILPSCRANTLSWREVNKD